MENSTKAILMVSGIFFALLTIGLLIIMLGNIQKMSQADDDKRQTKEIQEWNAEWEAYNKRIMYGSDVLTVVNKAAQTNTDFLNQKEYQITIKIQKEDETNLTDREMESYLAENQLSIFECTEIAYNNNTGRVNKMVFRNTGK